MVKKLKKAGIIIVSVFLTIYLCVCLLYKFYYIEQSKEYEKTDEVFYNPLMGFAVNADYPTAVEDSTLVYVDITWREWEPTQGFFDVEGVKERNHWERWKQEGKNVVLRFVCDRPYEKAHMDIPDWLYDMTGDGVFYDMGYSKGYAPDYNNPILIEKHAVAIEKLGEAFGQDHMVAYVQLGSLGHWGEWHTNYSEGLPRMPQEDVRRKYVEPYIKAFPNALLMARRPFAETADYGTGVYNDMCGDPKSTAEWLEWISVGGEYREPLEAEKLIPQPEIWKKAPVGGEFTSSRSYDEVLDTELERTIDLLQDSHMTFIGPKCPVTEELTKYEEGVSQVLKNIGYRYGVESAVLRHWKWAEKGKLYLTVNNYGVAPIYFDWKMYLYLFENGKICDSIEMPIDLRELSGGDFVDVCIEDVPVGEAFTYAIGVENPQTGEPAVWLDMACENKNMRYYLFED